MSQAIGDFTSDRGRAEFMLAYDDAMRHLPAPTATHDVATSYGSVRAYRFGPAEGIPLVLLPGKAASTPMWASNLPTLLNRRRQIVCIDLLGEPGQSVQTRPIAGAVESAQWLDETLAGLELPAVHLFGVSFGGWSAINLAIHRPDRVTSVIALDPANTFGRIGLKVIAFSMLALPFMPARVRNFALKWIAGGAEAPGDHPEGRLIAAGLKHFKSHLPAPAYPSDAELRALAVPALVIIAGRSIIHDPHEAAERARLLPRGQVELWPDASHALNGEFPERIAERTATFLAGLAIAAP